MKRKKIIKYVLLTLLVVIGATAFYIYKEYNRMHKDTAKVKPDYSLSATTLIKEFETDEQTANKKYWDKVIKVEGLVKAIAKDERGFYSISVGDTVSMSAVRCSIDSSHSNETIDVKEGSPIFIKGICSGFNADALLGSDVILVRSVIASK